MIVQRWRHFKAHAQTRIASLLKQLDDELARHGQPWFLGESFSAMGLYVFTLCRWTRNFSSDPARSQPHLGPYLQRMLARPAVQRVLGNELLSEPLG